MNTSAQPPKFPLWIFIATDVALLSFAALIALRADRPLTQSTILGIVALGILGAIVGLLPILMHFERQKNAELDDRQRALEALARTITSSAEQISIATGGLHEIAELAQRNLRHAEHLPQKLQEKIAEFQAQLAQNQDSEKEELERELLALRTSESERLDSVSQRIAKSTAEWTKLESSVQQHLAGATDALAKLSLATAAAIGKAQVAAEQALAQARTEAARGVGESSGQATHAIAAAKAAALTDLEGRTAQLTTRLNDTLAATVTAQLDRAAQLLDEKLARLTAELQRAPGPVVAATAVEPPPVSPSTGADVAPVVSAAPAQVPEAGSPSPEPAAAEDPRVAASAAAAPTVKRPRKPRRETPVTDPATAPDGTNGAHTAGPPPAPDASPVAMPTPAEHDAPVAPDGAAPATPESPAPEPAIPSLDDEPRPIPAHRITEIAPVVPDTAMPFTEGRAPSESSRAPIATATEEAGAILEPDAKPARARGRRSLDDGPSLDLGLDSPPSSSFSDSGSSDVMESGLSSDGATRLLVTAYIGIGNRLFIRGDGPGLRWDKGVPLQFVSIGKWRWETNDATRPVQFKIYKNDDVECAALGSHALEPGHQQEVTAAF